MKPSAALLLPLLLLLLLCRSYRAQEEEQENVIEKVDADQSGSCFASVLDVLTELKSMRNEMNATLAEAKSLIQQMRSGEKPLVVFTALAKEHGAIGPYNTDTTFIYRTMRINLGNAYNPSTGIFSAPVTGVYYFTFFGHAGGAHRMMLQLMKNSEVVADIHDHQSSHDTADNGGNAVFLQLHRGDHVYIRLPAGAHVWSGDSTTFSGFLLRNTPEETGGRHQDL